MSGRIVVTGAGVLAPNGLGVADYWRATLAGHGGVAVPERLDLSPYPLKVAGEIAGFEPAGVVPGRLIPQTDRTTRFALAGASWALEDAAADPSAAGRYDVGVVTANGCGGFEFGQRELQKLWSQGPHRVSAYQSFAWFYAVNTGQLSIRHGARGHGSVVVTEQAGGLDALAAARRKLRDGTLRLAVTGGVEAPLCPWGVTAQLPNGLLSEVPDPDRAYLPFDRDASGYVPGEGGAILVMETEDAARERGAPHLYGEIAGYAASFDPPPGSERPPVLTKAIAGALDDAGVRADQVDAVVPDAMGVPAMDRAEAAALCEVFGPRGVPVAVPKTMTGRLYSGGGPLDVVAALLMIRDGVVPAAANIGDIPAEYELDVVLERSRALPVRTVLVIARGLGGFNSALVVRGVPQ